MKEKMVIDHIAFVVPSLEQGLRQWCDEFGYQPMTQPVENSRQKVRVVFLRKAGSTLVKLVEAVGSDSPVARAAARGGGFHHLCFRCDNLADTIDQLVTQGARVLAAPQ